MILAFNGKARGIGTVDDLAGILIDYRFRSILPLFKGAPLAVFLCIALHADTDGHAFLSYDTLMAETGYASRSTIADALSILTQVTVASHRILHQYRERLDDGTFVGSNHYLIFPEDDLADDQSTVQSTESVPEVVNQNTEEPKQLLTVQKVYSGLDKHPAVLTYLGARGKFRGARTTLKDGRTVKDKAMEIIAETVGTDPDDLSFWERVVDGYITQGWSAHSYTNMLDYYTSGAIPPNKNRRVRHKVAPLANRTAVEQQRQDAQERISRARRKKETT